jgi:hypothetical protein
VISNPFGPFEEPRFCAYLMKTWRAGEIAEVRTPAYLRDNMKVCYMVGGVYGHRSPLSLCGANATTIVLW